MLVLLAANGHKMETVVIQLVGKVFTLRLVPEISAANIDFEALERAKDTTVVSFIYYVRMSGKICTRSGPFAHGTHTP